MTDPAPPPQAVADAIDALSWSRLLDGIDLEGWLRTIATVALEAGQRALRADEREQMRESVTAAFLAELGDQCRAEGAAAQREKDRQLAVSVNAGYYHISDPEPVDPPGSTMTTGSYEPFADLLGGDRPEPETDDVHVDWHMTHAEWAELRAALLAAEPRSPYVRQLRDAGKLAGPADLLGYLIGGDE